jgi:hypothetical protein
MLAERTRVERRWAAIASIAFGAAALALSIVPAVIDFPWGALGPVLLLLLSTASWQGLVRRGALHVAWFAIAALLAAADVAVQVARQPVCVLGALAALAVALAAASVALRIRVALPAAPRPSRPVLFWNPRSGGGKAARVHLADEACSDPPRVRSCGGVVRMARSTTARRPS